MATEFSSLVGGVEIDTRDMEPIQRIFAESLAEDILRANLNEKNRHRYWRSPMYSWKMGSYI